VNPASPNSPPPTTFTYDPSGMPTLSGQSNSFPFLYQGMEHEFLEPNQFYYGGNGQFYSAQIQRGFSIAGAQSTSGPGGPGPRRAHHGHHHGGGGGARGAALNGHVDAAATADVVEAGGGDTGSGDSGGGTPSSLPGLLEDFYNFFNDLFGGGGGQSLPPNYFVYQARLQRARRHPQYPKIDHIPRGIILSQDSVMTPADPINGVASSYNLPGMTTASGEEFDPNAFAAAMTGVPLGTEVTVAYNPGGNVTKKLNVRVNDRGPYAMDKEGRALRPLQPHPTRVIDLTPAAMKWLTGKETNLINVTVLIPAEKPEPLP